MTLFFLGAAPDDVPDGYTAMQVIRTYTRPDTRLICDVWFHTKFGNQVRQSAGFFVCEGGVAGNPHLYTLVSDDDPVWVMLMMTGRIARIVTAEMATP